MIERSYSLSGSTLTLPHSLSTVLRREPDTPPLPCREKMVTILHMYF